jgi:hypothetical protein
MPQNKERKRLHKSPPRQNSNKPLYSCTDIFDVVRAQSCLILAEDRADDALTDQGQDQSQEQTVYEAHVGYMLEKPLQNHHSNYSNDSLSHYSGSEMDDGDLKRRRCKTPVLYVGQLESKPLEIDPAKCLADQYRAELPPRVFTPSIEPQLAKPPRRRLRKIKCQLSLRDTIKEQAKSISYSDCETLVGSESPRSPASTISPTKSYFEAEQLNLVDKPQRRILTPDSQSWDALPGLDDDIALQMCTTLLSNELATALFKHHPAERGDRASGFQILLMIEAYEAMQQQIRRECYESQLMGQFDNDHVEAVDNILTHWLHALYAMYDRSQEKKSSWERIEEAGEMEEECWPLRRSEDLQATCVNGRGWS